MDLSGTLPGNYTRTSGLVKPRMPMPTCHLKKSDSTCSSTEYFCGSSFSCFTFDSKCHACSGPCVVKREVEGFVRFLEVRTSPKIFGNQITFRATRSY